MNQNYLVKRALITGLLIGFIYSLLLHFKIENTFLYAFISLFGLFFIFATNQTKKISKPLLSSILCSLLASIPVFFWQIIKTPTPTATFFIALSSAYAINAFHIAYYNHKTWLSYKNLFYAVSNSGISLFITMIFTTISWMLLYLCEALFEIINTNLSIITASIWFTPIYLSLATAMGLYISLSAKKITTNIRIIIASVCKFLLPLLAIISLLFLVAWGFSYKTTLTSFETIQWLFLSIAILSLLLFNGVYQEGWTKKPYPKIVQNIVHIFLIISPVFSILSLYFFIKTADFVSSDKVAMICNYFLIILYNVSYAIAACLRQKPWMNGIKKINITLAFVLIITALTTNNIWFNHLFAPLFKNPNPTSTNNKQKRYQEIWLSFEKKLPTYGASWQPITQKNPDSSAIILGYNPTPIYLCQSKQKVGVIINQDCTLIKQNKIYHTTDYRVLSGQLKNISWSQSLYNNKKTTVTFVAGYSKTAVNYICRTIYKNRIYVGLSHKNECYFIANNAIVTTTQALQFLQLKIE